MEVAGAEQINRSQRTVHVRNLYLGLLMHAAVLINSVTEVTPVSRYLFITFLAICINTHTHTHTHIVQELCESRGGRPGLSVLTSLLASVDVKIY